MRRKSIGERIRLLGRAGIDVVGSLGASTVFLLRVLFGRGNVGNGFTQLLIKL